MEGMAAEEKGRGYRLQHEESAAEGAPGRLRAGREGGRTAARAAGRGRSPSAIHGARKDLKKLRAVLRLVRDELGEKTYRAENRATATPAGCSPRAATPRSSWRR